MILTRIKGEKYGVKWSKPGFFETRESGVVQGPVFCVSMYCLVFERNRLFQWMHWTVRLLNFERCIDGCSAFSAIVTPQMSYINVATSMISDKITEYE
jgi:hypothetical protein